MKLTVSGLTQKLRTKANKKKAKILSRFFKTGPDEYGQGDVFLGVVVPETRKTAKKYRGLPLSEVKKLLMSKIYEERLAALFILVDIFQKGEKKKKKEVVNFYLKATKHINNWDLVDLSADKILGAYLLDKPKSILYKLCYSKNIWERRISIMATFNFIKNNSFSDTLKIAKILLKDEHDLIQKAVGWMLRETGKRLLKTEEHFLKNNYLNMPRTALRYAIEKFPEKKRQSYLSLKI